MHVAKLCIENMRAIAGRLDEGGWAWPWAWSLLS